MEVAHPPVAVSGTDSGLRRGAIPPPRAARPDAAAGAVGARAPARLSRARPTPAVGWLAFNDRAVNAHEQGGSHVPLAW